jgi:NitT/TauT family transport system substrate-binding protein
MFLLVFGLFWGTGTAESASRSVRVAYLQNDLHHLALWVALDKGFFRDEGLDVQIAGIFRSGPEIMTAFGAGELDVAYVGEAPATIAVARGTAHVKVLAQANTEGTALVVSNAVSGSALQSKSLAIPGHGTVQDLLLRKALAGLEVDPKSINTIVLSPPEMITALQAGQIDGFIAWEPYPSKAVSMGLGRVLAASSGIWPGHPCCILAGSESFLRSHPQETRALVRAHERASVYITGHKDEAVAVAVKFTGMDESVVRRAMEGVTYTSRPSIEGEEEYVKFLNYLGYITTEDVKGFVNRFIVGDQSGSGQ